MIGLVFHIIWFRVDLKNKQVQYYIYVVRLSFTLLEFHFLRALGLEVR